jgi:L-lactate dehydrogenase complex protein LldE
MPQWEKPPLLVADGGYAMRVALFVTCLVDLMRPRIGFAAIRLLEAAGCEVAVPETQTCCGQPAYNAGDREAAAALARKVIAEFEGFEYVVVPSGSCAEHIRNAYPGLLADEPQWHARAVALAGRVYELTAFLADVARLQSVPGDFRGSVTYHDSCSGLRGLGIKAQPRALLGRMPGVELREMKGAEECCGFGGTFSVKFGEISAAIAERKCANARATAADAIVGGDLGCLLSIEGKLRRMGDETTKVLHVAEVLAGGK